MSLEPLVDRREVEDAFVRLCQTVQQDAEVFDNRKISFPRESGSEPERYWTVYWNPEHHIWSCLTEHWKKPQYWCCYGIENPAEQMVLRISCEINPPLQGINPHLAGAFLRKSSDRESQVFYAHSGKLNLKGVKQKGFLDFYRRRGGTLEEIPTLGREMVILGSVEDRAIIPRIADFVRAVERCKPRRR